MLVLPLLYLFWWKKSWRLAVGAILLVIVGVSFFVPNEIVYSLVNRKIKKEQRNLTQQEEQVEKQLKELQNKDFSALPSSENSEKIVLEKEIAKLQKEIQAAHDLHSE